MNKLTITSTKPKQIIDITDQVNDWLNKEQVQEGTCHLFLLHTSCAITTADLDPGTDVDMLEAFDEMVPKLNYRHPHDPGHVPDHILSSLIGSSLLVPVKDSKLLLGTWQRVVLVELNGSKERNLMISIV